MDQQILDIPLPPTTMRTFDGGFWVSRIFVTTAQIIVHKCTYLCAILTYHIDMFKYQKNIICLNLDQIKQKGPELKYPFRGTSFGLDAEGMDFDLQLDTIWEY